MCTLTVSTLNSNITAMWTAGAGRGRTATVEDAVLLSVTLNVVQQYDPCCLRPIQRGTLIAGYKWTSDTKTHTHTWSCNCRSYDKQSFLLGDQFTHTHTHIHTNTHTDTDSHRHPHTHTSYTHTHSQSLSLSLSLAHTHTHTHTCVMTINALPVTKGRSTGDVGVELWPVPVTHRGPHTIIEHLQSAFIPTAATNQSHRGCGCDAYKDVTEEKMGSHLVLMIFWLSSHLENGTRSLKLVWLCERFCHADSNIHLNSIQDNIRSYSGSHQY